MIVSPETRFVNFFPDFLDQYDDVLIIVLSYSWYRKKMVNSLAGIGLDTSMHYLIYR